LFSLVIKSAALQTLLFF